MKGTWIKLVGKTRHGKNRINQHGDTWLVMEEKTFQGQTAFLLRSFDKTEGTKDSKGFDTRWVHVKDDQNFFIESL